MPVGKPLHLRLFLEGEEVPVISAQVQINTSAPATASIQIIPLDSAMDFLPRTMVHLFFLDTKVVQKFGPLQPGDERNSIQGTYRLLFSGEVIGFAFSQTPVSRGIVLQCLDFSNYWDSAHVMAISYGPGGNAFTNDGSMNGAQMGTFTDIPGDSAAEHLVRWVKSKPVTEGLDQVSGLAGGVIHIMEAMGGVPGHFSGINDFYTIAELRCRLLNQITAEEKDDTAARVLSVGVFHEWLKNGIEQAGGNITFRDMMKLLFQYIYYEFVPNPAAKYDESTRSEKTKVSYKIRTHPGAQGAKSLVEKVIEVFMSNREGFAGTGLELNAASGAAVDMTKDGKLTMKVWRKTVQGQIPKLNLALDKLTSIQTKVGQAYNLIAEADAVLSAWAVRPLDGDDRLVLAATLRPTVVAEQSANLQKAVDILSNSDTQALSTVTAKNSSARLRTQIVRPDCWFSSPPVCNVIFPEMYASISYDRNYLQETTRLLVHTFDTLIGKEHLFANHVMAPLVGLDTKKLTQYKGSQSFRVLMDHEIHVGILSKTEWMPNTAGVSNALDAEQMKKVRDGRLSWTIKASLFNFFKYRFAPRSVSVTGRFNPFLVCGFPGVVITKPYNIPGGAADLRAAHGNKDVPDSEINDVIHQKATELHAPSHFIGMIGGIQHSLDQSGGTTSVSMHHARKHRGVDDEFLGVLAKTNEGVAKRVVKVVIDIDTALKMASGQIPAPVTSVADAAAGGHNEPANRIALDLLIGVTPQTDESAKASTPVDAPSVLRAKKGSQNVKKVNPTAADIGAAIKSGLSPLDLRTKSQKATDEQFDATFGSTQVSEQPASTAPSEASKQPPRTQKGSISEANLVDINVPKGSHKVKVGGTVKGLYGGRIVGIQVLDPSLLEAEYGSTITKMEAAKISGDATGLTDAPGFLALQDSLSEQHLVKRDPRRVPKGKLLQQGGPDFEIVRTGKLIKKVVPVKKLGWAFRSVAIFEEIDVSVSGTLPIEEILRPSWFSTAYANQNIGEKIYNPFFGCGAVVDGLSVSGTAPQSSDGSSESEPVDAATSAKTLMVGLEAAEAGKRDNSIEKALNLLGYEYGQVKTQGMDVDSFIRDYTDRPIATFNDIFGDIAEPGGLHFTIEASSVGGNAVVEKTKVDSSGVKSAPRVGFHTGATHPELVKAGKLVGLTTDLQQGFTRVSGIGKETPLVQKYDVRYAKKLKVTEYLTALARGPGFHG